MGPPSHYGEFRLWTWTAAWFLQCIGTLESLGWLTPPAYPRSEISDPAKAPAVARGQSVDPQEQQPASPGESPALIVSFNNNKAALLAAAFLSCIGPDWHRRWQDFRQRGRFLSSILRLSWIVAARSVHPTQRSSRTSHSDSFAPASWSTMTRSTTSRSAETSTSKRRKSPR
jgi:hypothetical protein